MPIGVTVQHSDIVIEGIRVETQRAVGKVDLKIQPESSGKVFIITFHIVPKDVFNLLGANFTDRYELANIIAFQARRLRAEDTHVVARTTVVSHVLERLTGCMTRREAQRTPVQWTKAAVLPFLKIKHKLIHFAYNYIIDPEAPLVIYADSSLTAIGAALTQKTKGVN